MNLEIGPTQSSWLLLLHHCTATQSVPDTTEFFWTENWSIRIVLKKLVLQWMFKHPKYAFDAHLLHQMIYIQVPSYVMLGVQKQEEAPATPQHPLSQMGEACSRVDLTAIHQILVTTHYRDDEITNELSFQEWTQQMRDILDARRRGDFAFRDKDFRIAIECYSQFIDVGTMVSPTVYARRSLCYLMCDQPDPALRDAMQAQCVYPEWPTAFYMQAVALAKMKMQSDAMDMLHEASKLEEKRQKGGRSPQ